MNTKLTLSMDKSVIASAKKELLNNENSLSRLIEDYFKLLLSIKSQKNSYSPVVEELSGIAKTNDSQNDSDIVTSYLLDKYQ